MTTRDCLALTPRSRHWPTELSVIRNPPEQLWLRGDPSLLEAKPRVAIVGTRAPTPYGEAQAQRFSSVLARAGVSIVSGLARGIDQCAHAAALAEGGVTLAVLGSGVDRPWPADEVTERVTRDGLLISEFAPGTTPRPHHVPLRNRVISGLADIVLVIEAAARSGSLIPANWAADQGKLVGALPGRVDHPMARGVHRLLRDGAMLVESPDELLAELDLARPSGRGVAGGGGPLCEALTGETLSADELADRLDRPVGDVLAELVVEELAGRVVRAPGGLFRRA